MPDHLRPVDLNAAGEPLAHAQAAHRDARENARRLAARHDLSDTELELLSDEEVDLLVELDSTPAELRTIGRPDPDRMRDVARRALTELARRRCSALDPGPVPAAELELEVQEVPSILAATNPARRERVLALLDGVLGRAEDDPALAGAHARSIAALAEAAETLHALAAAGPDPMPKRALEAEARIAELEDAIDRVLEADTGPKRRGLFEAGTVLEELGLALDTLADVRRGA